ncbi:hypothetical protein ACFL2I_07420 [Candidatus Omnitrophota bacterium]
MMTLDKEGYYALALFHLIKKDFNVSQRYLSLAQKMGFDKKLVSEISDQLPIR